MRGRIIDLGNNMDGNMLLTKLINMAKRAEGPYDNTSPNTISAQFLTLYPRRNFVGYTIVTSFRHTNRDS